MKLVCSSAADLSRCFSLLCMHHLDANQMFEVMCNKQGA